MGLASIHNAHRPFPPENETDALELITLRQKQINNGAAPRARDHDILVRPRNEPTVCMQEALLQLGRSTRRGGGGG